VYGCSREEGSAHPQASRVKDDQWYIGGRVQEKDGILHTDFIAQRRTPTAVKKIIGDSEMIGFQTRNPLHYCHVELIRRAMRQVPNTKVLLHPVVGPTQPGDIPYAVRIKCYQALLKVFPPGKVILSLLPLAMRMAGPREALWHALIRKNYGCSYFIVGRDHAGPSVKKADGTPFFAPYAAQELCLGMAERIGMKFIVSQAIHYVPGLGVYLTGDEKHPDEPSEFISGTQLRGMLKDGKDVPSWFSPPSVISILKNYYAGGLCVYLTGLSGAGKTTLALLLQKHLQEVQSRKVTILDGDVIRTHLSAGLGFSREDRSRNVRRIGYVASEIVKHGGIVICANIAPFREDRDFNRRLVSSNGRYIQVYLSTPIEVCEKRDVKGLYKKVREGKIKNFTGIDSPYEVPSSEEMTTDDLTLPTSNSLEETLGRISDHLNLYL